MKKELEQLMKLAGTSKYDAKLEALYRKYKDDPEAKKKIASFIKSGIATSGSKIEQIEKIINVREQLSDVADIISLSTIAQTYFGKTRSWLYQRINGNIVNGKPSKFTDAELTTLTKALNEISLKTSKAAKNIGSLSLNG
ncbi:DUF5053 domain-containing protein [Agriterribacter sp.]|uniref:DUF5053 domain-containing protein n=1 Tax=Agriterribacter sp. TaxID=2821509 RepID=UPI002CA22DF6|nr:DUF5053 domain-containing protein [Agriterribacter sp.]HRP54568.1 DUF5053 domain-containing protein [Agriterribacter sp.]